MLRPHQGDIVRKVVELAKSGDTTAIGLVLERICPSLRSGDLPVVAIALSGDTVTAKAEGILAAVCNGSVSPEQGAKLVDMLASVARVMEIDLFAARVAALEQAMRGVAGESDRGA